MTISTPFGSCIKTKRSYDDLYQCIHISSDIIDEKFKKFKSSPSSTAFSNHMYERLYFKYFIDWDNQVNLIEFQYETQTLNCALTANWWMRHMSPIVLINMLQNNLDFPVIRDRSHTLFFQKTQ